MPQEYVCRIPGRRRQPAIDNYSRQDLYGQSIIVHNALNETKGQMALRLYNDIRERKGYDRVKRMPKGTKYSPISKRHSDILRQCRLVLPKMKCVLSGQTGIWSLDVYQEIPVALFTADGGVVAKFLVEGEYWYCVENRALDKYGYAVPRFNWHIALACCFVKVHYTEVHKYLKAYMDDPEKAEKKLEGFIQPEDYNPLSYVGDNSPTISYTHREAEFDFERGKYLKGQEILAEEEAKAS
jgi:hypothetical protein